MVTEIEKQCSFYYCKIHSFLPFLCKYCKKSFCMSHQNAEDHECEVSEEIQKKLTFCEKNNISVKNEKECFLICDKCKGLISIEYKEGNLKEYINEIYDMHIKNDCKNSRTEPKFCFYKDCIYNKYCIVRKNRKCPMCKNIFCYHHMNAVNHNCTEVTKNILNKREEIKLKFQKKIMSNNGSNAIREKVKSQIVNSHSTNEKYKQMEEKIFKMKIKLNAVGMNHIQPSSRVFVKIIFDSSVFMIKKSFQIEKKTHMIKDDRSVNLWFDGESVIGKIIDMLTDIFKASIYSQKQNKFLLYKILKYTNGSNTLFEQDNLCLLKCSSFCRNVLNDGDIVLLK